MQNESKPTRRLFSCALAVALLIQASPTAAAPTRADAEQLVLDASNEILAIIGDEDTEPVMFRRFHEMLETFADIPIIARSTLGVDWRAATPEQRDAYTSAFGSYLSRKYGKRFRELIGATIRIVRTRSVKSGVLVESTMTLEGKSPFAVDWQVSDKSGRNRIFNLYIEGVSLLASERQEVRTMLDLAGGDIDRLIEDLKTSR